MRTIRLLTNRSGPDEKYPGYIGDVFEAEDAEAKDLVESGNAEFAVTPPAEQPTAGPATVPEMVAATDSARADAKSAEAQNVAEAEIVNDQADADAANARADAADAAGDKAGADKARSEAKAAQAKLDGAKNAEAPQPTDAQIQADQAAFDAAPAKPTE